MNLFLLLIILNYFDKFLKKLEPTLIVICKELYLQRFSNVRADSMI